MEHFGYLPETLSRLTQGKFFVTHAENGCGNLALQKVQFSSNILIFWKLSSTPSLFVKYGPLYFKNEFSIEKLLLTFYARSRTCVEREWFSLAKQILLKTLEKMKSTLEVQQNSFRKSLDSHCLLKK